jgi:hypothetical protein
MTHRPTRTPWGGSATERNHRRPRSTVYSDAEIASRFRWSSDTERRADITCGYCERTLERKSEENARKWFAEHECTSAAPAPRDEFTCRKFEREWQSELLFVLHVRRLETQLQALVKMSPEFRYYGGHRTRLEAPTAERREHEQRVDELLARMFAPTAGVVLPFPTRTPPEVEAIAA